MVTIEISEASYRARQEKTLHYRSSYDIIATVPVADVVQLLLGNVLYPKVVIKLPSAISLVNLIDLRKRMHNTFLTRHKSFFKASLTINAYLFYSCSFLDLLF